MPFDRSYIMLNRLSFLIGFVALAASAAAAVHAETLLVERVQQERGATMPARGITMAQVEQQFGAPSSKLTPAGGDAPTHPVINRWAYDRFTVYFERDRVVDSVLNRASATEIGPKGAEPAK
jgi:hypothetical protein